MSRRMIVCAAVAVALAHCACAELLTFTNAVKNSGGQYQWDNKLNWLTADGANKAPAEGDDLLCATKITTFHAVATGNYFKSVRMKYGFDYSGFSWRAPCLKEGGDGLVLEGGVGLKYAYGPLWLDGTVTLCLSNAMTLSGSTIGGRSATNKGRFLKTGPSQLGSAKVADNFTGGTIREGTFMLDSDSGKSGLDFHFDGAAASAYFTLGGNINLADGAITSTADLPTTAHGVNASGEYTLTISGTPKVADMYYAGGFHGSASFRFAPSAANCSFTLARSVSTTTRKIAVSNAVLRVTDGASFTALRALVAEAGGLLRIDAATGCKYALNIEGGQVEVPEGGVLEVANVTTNNAVLPEGEYTAENCSWVAGGTVRVSMSVLYNDPIILDVPSDSAYLPDALDAYNAAQADDPEFTPVTLESLNGGADKARTLVKTGAGSLYMTNDIRNFEGSVHVAEGVLQTRVRYSIGKESNANAPVYVHNGATFSSSTTNKNMNTGRTFHITGVGAAGWKGALHCAAVGISNTYDLSNVFGSHLILYGDATVNVGAWVRAAEDVRLNGYTLTIAGNSKDDSPFYLRGGARRRAGSDEDRAVAVRQQHPAEGCLYRQPHHLRRRRRVPLR